MFLQSKNIWKDTADNRLTVDELKNKRYLLVDYLTMIKIKKEIIEDKGCGLPATIKNEKMLRKYEILISETEQEINEIDQQMKNQIEIINKKINLKKHIIIIVGIIRLIQ